MDIEPITKGHTLLIPKKHFLDFRDFDQETLQQFGETQKAVIQILQENLGRITGFTTYQSNGKGAKQVVMHAHLHIIPRYENDFGYSVFDRGPENTRKKIDEDWAKEFTEKI